MQPAPPDPSPPRDGNILDYARPAERRAPPRWLTVRINPELGLLLWACAALAFVTAEGRGGEQFVACALIWYLVARSFEWNAGWAWRVLRFVTLSAFTYGVYRFVEPWAYRRFSLDYWLIYNQTYAGNYDASLRWTWLDICGAGAVATTLFAHWLTHRTHRPPACPPPSESK